MTLHDLLTQNIQGNPLSNISLGDANDPQYNKFSFNVFGSLRQGTGEGSNGVIDRTKMQGVFGGPYNIPFPFSMPQTPREQRQARRAAEPPPLAGAGGQAGTPPRNQFAPIGSFNQFYDQNFPIGVSGFQQGIAPSPAWGGAGGPLTKDTMGGGTSLMNRMLAWKG